MSDFFSRLAARTLGQAPLAAPLRRSAHTAPAQEVPPESPTPVSELPPAGTPQPGERVPSQATRIHHPLPEQPAAGLEHVLNAGAPPLRAPEPVPAPRGGDFELMRAQPETPEGTDIQPAPSARAGWQPQPVGEPLPPDLSPRLPDSAQEAAPGPQWLVPVYHAPPGEAPPPTRPAATGPELPEPEDKRAAAHLPAPEHPLSTGQFEKDLPLFPLPDDGLPGPLGRERPPEIQVTIGRVEIRAIAPPPAPPRQPARPRTPGLTLEQYLKQRSGEGT
jgi:hypothetical protein